MATSRVYPEEIIDYQVNNNLGIKKCKCQVIVPLSPDKEDICGCLLPISEHHPDAVRKPELKKWTRENCAIEDGDTDAYGQIYFQGFDYDDSPSKYIRVSYQTEMDTLLSYLFKTWSLKKPKLLISVTGGAKVSIKNRLKETFCQSLVKAATTTNAWITSGGSYNGCMKLVGQAFENNALSVSPDEKVVVLGIASWCSVTNKEKLKIDHPDNLNGKVSYDLFKPPHLKGKHELLDPNHSHFILVDDAKHDFGGEVVLRADLEAKLAETENIPIVVLVIGGGPRTAESVFEAVKKKTPCVFLDSSGELANIFSFALKRKQEMIKRKIEPLIKTEANEYKLNEEFQNEIRQKLIQTYPNKKPPEIDHILKFIESSLVPEYSHLLTVCKPINGKAEIDMAVLKALLQAERENTMRDKTSNRDPVQAQLRLALEWNRIDIARDYILTEEVKDRINTFEDFMYMAIKQDRAEFVDLFIDNGFVLKNFLTNRVLLKLYNEKYPNSLLQRLLDKKRFGQALSGLRIRKSKRKSAEAGRVYSFQDIGQAIQLLLNDFYRHQFCSSPYTIVDHKIAAKILQDTNDYGKPNPEVLGIFTRGKEIFNSDEKFESPEHQLFMYSILLGRLEMAKLFCLNGRSPISSCLIGVKISEQYQDMFGDELGVYQKIIDEFKVMGREILQAGFDMNEDKAELVLLKRNLDFGKTTSIQAASAFNNLDLMSHPCYQNVVTDVWYNRVVQETSMFIIAICLFCPILAPVLINFHQTGRESTGLKIKQPKVSVESESNPVDPTQQVISDRARFFKNRVNEESKKKLIMNNIAYYFNNLYFYYKTPMIKFFYYQIWYLLFLLLFSYVMLCDFYPLYEANPDTSRGLAISVPEIVLFIWVVTFAMDEIRILHTTDRKLFKARVWAFLTNYLNLIKLAALLLYMIGFILRLIPDSNCFLAAKIILCIDLILWYFKMLFSYVFMKRLGPKLFMIRKMTMELIYFLLIVVLFMFAFGISTQAMMYGNQPLNAQLLRQVFFPAFFIIGGEYYTRGVLYSVTGYSNYPLAGTSETCSSNSTDDEPSTVFGYYDSCPDELGSQFSLALYVVYLVFLNILLVNLLIAIFNNTYMAVTDEADKIWKSQRYHLVYEYFQKPLFSPPMVLFVYALMIIQFVVRRFYLLSQRGKKKTQEIKDESGNVIQVVPRKPGKFAQFIDKLTRKEAGFEFRFENPQDEENIIKWEKLAADEYIDKVNQKKEEDIDLVVEKNIDKLDRMANIFDDFLENGNQEISKKIEFLNSKIQTILKALDR